MMVVKIGGGAGIDLAAAAEDLAALDEPVVVVLGANAERDRLAGVLGVPVRRVTSASGYTSVLTDEPALDLLMMAYAGLRAKRLVEHLLRRGADAVSLSGLDGRLVRARRNRGIRTVREGRKFLLRDRSGKPVEVNLELLSFLLEKGYLPVITVPVADEEGYAVSTENDEVVTLLARGLRAERVVHLVEAPGLLREPSDPTSCIPRLAPGDLPAWESRVEGRMKRKLHAISKLFEDGREPAVAVADGRVSHPLRRALEGGGTWIG